MEPLSLEKKILITAAVLALSFFAVFSIAIPLFGIGLPTCITDIKPFQKSEVLFHSPTHYEVHYVAKMWAFEPADLTIPANSTVDIYLSSVDVVHGFHIAGTNVNLMAVPGVVNYRRVRFDKPGTYDVICHEYCGSGHHHMTTSIRVTDPALGTQPSRVAAQPPTQAGHPGQKVLQDRACLACHTLDGKPGTGPTFKGILGRKEQLQSGKEITVDEPYLRESIREPTAQVVKGFAPTMPKLPLTDDEVNQIVDYLKTIR